MGYCHAAVSDLIQIMARGGRDIVPYHPLSNISNEKVWQLRVATSALEKKQGSGAKSRIHATTCLRAGAFH